MLQQIIQQNYDRNRSDRTEQFLLPPLSLLCYGIIKIFNDRYNLTACEYFRIKFNLCQPPAV